MRSTGADAIRRGWIEVKSETASVRGLLTYRDAGTGVEVGIEPGRLRDHFALFVEESSGIGTGLAIFKPEASAELALIMYAQMQEAFGWDACRQVFATYRALSDEERPKNDDEKRDQWLVRFSRQVGRNLGPFFQTWGVPTSQAARDSIKDLPVWMPPGFPPAR